MKGRPQDYMDVGILHFMAFPEVMKGEGPVLETLRMICEDDYFQVVEVTQIKDASVRKSAIETVRKAEMKAAFGAQPVLLGGGLDLNASEPAERQKALDAVKESIEEAREWHCTGLAVLSGKDPGAEQRDLAKALLVASPTDEAALIADKVYPYFPSFGLLLDLSHLPLLDEAGETAIKTAGSYLRHAHIGNCVKQDAHHPAYGDNHPVMGTPGGEVGVDELATFLKALLETGYIREGGHNIVSFEVKPFGGQTSDEVITQSKAMLDAAWAAL